MKTRFLTPLLVGALVAPLAAQATLDDVTNAKQDPKPAPVAAIKLDQRTPESTITSIVTNLKAGKAHAILSAFTDEDNAELQNIVQGVVAKVDPKVWDMMVGVVGQLGTVLKHNKNYIANNPMMSGGEKPEEIVKSIDAACASLATLKDGQLGSHAKASKIQLRDFLASSGGKMMDFANEPASGADFSLDDIEIGEAKIDGESAYITVTMDGEPKDFKMKSVQGNWYFDMKKTLASLKDDADGMEKMTKQDAMQIGGMMQQLVVPTLKKFEDIESQEEFDEQVQGLMGMIMGMMGGMGGGGFGGPPPGGGGFGK